MRERQTERQTERERGRERDRQRECDRERERETGRERDRESEREREIILRRNTFSSKGAELRPHLIFYMLSSLRLLCFWFSGQESNLETRKY